jgi:hypothetical protein
VHLRPETLAAIEEGLASGNGNAMIANLSDAQKEVLEQMEDEDYDRFLESNNFFLMLHDANYLAEAQEVINRISDAEVADDDPASFPYDPQKVRINVAVPAMHLAESSVPTLLPLVRSSSGDSLLKASGYEASEGKAPRRRTKSEEQVSLHSNHHDSDPGVARREILVSQGGFTTNSRNSSFQRSSPPFDDPSSEVAARPSVNWRDVSAVDSKQSALNVPPSMDGIPAAPSKLRRSRSRSTSGVVSGVSPVIPEPTTMPFRDDTLRAQIPKMSVAELRKALQATTEQAHLFEKLIQQKEKEASEQVNPSRDWEREKRVYRMARSAIETDLEALILRLQQIEGQHGESMLVSVSCYLRIL